MKSKKAASVPIESLPDGEELPEGWKSIILEDYVYIAARIGWRGLKRGEYTKTGPLFLAVKDIQENGAIGYQNVTDHLSEFRYDESPEIQLKNQDIIITKDGTIGKIGFVENLPGKVTVNSSLLVVRPSPEILPRFLFFYFRSRSFQSIVHDRITGSAVPHLFQKDIKKFQILVPPLAEQQRIVARVEALLTHINAARDKLSRVPLIMKKFRQGVQAAACSGRLTDGRDNHRYPSFSFDQIKQEHNKNVKRKFNESIQLELKDLPDLPDNWTWINFSLLINKIKRGPSLKCNQEGKGVRYITSGNLENGRLRLDYDQKFLADFNDIDKCQLKHGDLILNCVNSLDRIGKSAIFEENHGTAIVGFNNYGLELNQNFIFYMKENNNE